MHLDICPDCVQSLRVLTETDPAALTATRTAPGVYTVRAGGHAFFVMRDNARAWGIEGLDNRTEAMCCAGIYHGTAYAAANEIARDMLCTPTLKAAKALIAAAV